MLDNPFSFEMGFGDSIIWEDCNFDNLEDFRLKGITGAAQSRRFDAVFLQNKNGTFRLSQELSELDTFEVNNENNTIRSRWVPNSSESKVKIWEWHSAKLKLIKTIDNLISH